MFQILSKKIHPLREKEEQLWFETVEADSKESGWCHPVFRILLDNMFGPKDEPSNWDPARAKGYLVGAQWFNPMSVIPHPILQQRLPVSKRISFDAPLMIFGMMFDSQQTIVDVATKNKTGTIKSYRSFLRVMYCNLLNLIFLANVIRGFSTYFMKDRLTKFYYGDMSVFWTKRPHFLTVPILFIHFSALIVNLCFQLKQKDIQKRWLVPFGIFTGSISPVSVRMRSVHQMRRLIQAVQATFKYTHIIVAIWTAGAGFLYISTALKYTVPHLRWIGLGWGIWNTLMCFYSFSIVGWSLAYFHCVAYYLRLRFKRLNKITYALMDADGLIPTSKRNDFMAEVIYEHDKAAHDVGYWNRFWKYWLLVTYGMYIPLEFWLLYACWFYKTTWTVKIILWLAFMQFGLNIGFIIASGEMVSNQAHLCYKWLNALCLHKFPVSIMIKMAELIERLGGPTVGFTCFDFFVVARETFYDVST